MLEWNGDTLRAGNGIGRGLRAGHPNEREFFEKALTILAGVGGASALFRQVPLAGDGRLLERVRPAAKLAGNAFGLRFQI